MCVILFIVEYSSLGDLFYEQPRWLSSGCLLVDLL